MALNLNTSPYYDDFDATKNYSRILFRPGVAVQARELTQLQTILQNQISRFGEHIFVDGAPVLGCKETKQMRQFVKIDDIDSNGDAVSNDDLESYIGDTLTGGTSGIKAVIQKVRTGTEQGEEVNKKTLYIAYTQGSTTTGQTAFTYGEILTVTSTDPERDGKTFVVDTQRSPIRSRNYRGEGTFFTIGEGLLYVDGRFVEHTTQDVLVSPYGERVNKYVGVLVNDTVVTSEEDSTLLDPANGTFNYNAPGADRYKIVTELTTRDLDAELEPNFISLFSIVDGRKSTSVIDEDLRIYGMIGDRIAERTYLESGHYSIKTFEINVREHLLDVDDNNGGFLTAGNGGNAAFLAIGVGHGEAIVAGRRKSIDAPQYLKVPKGITTELQESIITSTTYGNYVRVNNMAGEWDINNNEQVILGAEPLDANMSNTGILTIGAIGAADSRRQKGNYLVGPGKYTTSASGQDAAFMVKVDAQGACTVQILEGGSGFTSTPLNEVITIPDARLGAGGAADLQFSVTSLGADRSNTYGAVAPPATRIGTARVRHIKREYGTPGDPDAVYRLYLYDIRMSGGALKDVRSVYFDSPTTNFNGAADVLTDNSAAQALVFKPDLNRMVFKMPTRAMKTLGVDPINTWDNTFTYQKEIDLTLTTSGTVQYSLSGTESFPYSSVPTQTQLDDEWIFVFKETVTIDGVDYAAGEIFDLQESHFVESGTGPSGISLDLGTTLSNQCDIKIYAKVRSVDSTPVPLVANKSRYVKIDTSTHENGANGPWKLGLCNVYKLESVFVGDDYDDTITDYREQFKILSGQGDNFYGHSELVKNGSLNTTNKKILVKLHYLNPNYAGSNSTYFAVDSYPTDELFAENPSFYTYEIPLHLLGGRRTYDLRDCIDFRPYIENTAVDATTIATATENPEDTFIIRTISGGYQYPVPDESYVTDGEYYLGRIDRIVLDSAGIPRSVRGVAKRKPVPPQFPNSSMLLADVVIPPYPSIPLKLAGEYNRDDLAVRLDIKSNKRYTMQDIGAIEKRLKRLEYYSSLNFLEQYTADTPVTKAGQERFKLGFFVEPFTNHELMNVNDPDLSFGIPKHGGHGTATVVGTNLDLEYNSTQSNNTVITGNLITLPYTHVTHSANRVASRPRNCVGDLLFNYTGDCRAYPMSDNYSNTSSGGEQTVTVTGPGDAIRTFGNNLGNAGFTSSSISMQGAGNINSSSSSSDTSTTTYVVEDGYEETFEIGEELPDGSVFEGIKDADGNVIEGSTATSTADVEYSTTTTTTVTNNLSVSTANIRQTTRRLDVSVGSDWTRTEGTFQDLVSDLTFRSHIRARVIMVEATRLKPNTRYYVFFDGAAASDRIDNLTDRVRKVPWSTWQTYSSSVRNQGRWQNWAGRTSIQSDDEGNLAIAIRIPSNTYLLGTKKIIISDDVRNRKSYVTSSAETSYSQFMNSTVEYSDLTIKSQQPNVAVSNTNLGTRTVGTVATNVSLNTSVNTQTGDTTSSNINPGLYTTLPEADPETEETNTDTTEETGADTGNATTDDDQNEQILTFGGPQDDVVDTVVDETPDETAPTEELEIDWRLELEELGLDLWMSGEGGMFYADPIAQTFTVTSGYGVYLTKMNLDFRTKPTTGNNGITVEIRDTVNGFPGSSVVPYSTVFKPLSEVNVSSETTAGVVTYNPTTFTFESPVYLAPGEYCFVVKPQGNDPAYNLWAAKLGENKNGTTQRIVAGDVTEGVLFTSSNDRAWSPVQDEDIKYELFRANFSTTSGTAILQNDDVDYLTLTDFTSGFFAEGDPVFGFDITLNAGGSGHAVNDVITLAAFGNGSGLNVTVTGVNSGVITDFEIGQMGSGFDTGGDHNGIVQLSTTGSGTGAQFDVTVKTGAVKEFDRKNAYSSFYVFSGSFNPGEKIATDDSQAEIVEVQDKKFNKVMPNLTHIKPEQTGISYKIAGTKPSGVATPGTTYIPTPIEVPTVTSEGFAAYSYSNEATILSGKKSFSCEVLFSTPSSTVSPALDITRSSYVIDGYVINNDSTGEDGRTGGSAECRYISKIIKLDSGNPAEDLAVYIDQLVPDDADVEVYGKFLAVEDDARFREDLYWVKLDKKTSSSSKTAFVETKYEIPLRNTNKVGLGGASGDTLEYIASRVDATSITNAGSGYTATPPVTFSGGGAWRQATGVAQLSGGTVVGITVTDPGRGYTSAPTITIGAPTGGGTTATATATIADTTFVGFKDFAIKVVLKAGNTSKVPIIQKLRAIAVQV